MGIALSSRKHGEKRQESFFMKQIESVKRTFPESCAPIDWSSERSVAAHSAINTLENALYHFRSCNSAGHVLHRKLKSISVSRFSCRASGRRPRFSSFVTFDAVSTQIWTANADKCGSGSKDRDSSGEHHVAYEALAGEPESRSHDLLRGSSHEGRKFGPLTTTYVVGTSNTNSALSTQSTQYILPFFAHPAGTCDTTMDADTDDAAGSTLSVAFGSPTDSTMSLCSTPVSENAPDIMWFSSHGKTLPPRSHGKWRLRRYDVGRISTAQTLRNSHNGTRDWIWPNTPQPAKTALFRPRHRKYQFCWRATWRRTSGAQCCRRGSY